MKHVLKFSAFPVFNLVFTLCCLPISGIVTYINSPEKSLIAIDRDRFKDIPIFADKADYFVWPDRERIKDRARHVVIDENYPEAKKTYPNWITTEKVSDVDAKYMAFKWIMTILKPAYLPDDLFDHLILLDGAENQADIVCVRYQIVIEYEIQIVQTNSELFIVVGQPDALGRDDFVKNMDPVTAGSMVEDIVSNLFDKSEAISVMHSLSEIKSTDGFYYLNQKWFSNTRGSNQWWGNVSWWTDGITVAFYIPKFYGGSLIPFGLTDDWF